MGWGGHPEQIQAEEQSALAQAQPWPYHECLAEWPEWVTSSHPAYSCRSKGGADMAAMWLRDAIYSRLQVR